MSGLPATRTRGATHADIEAAPPNMVAELVGGTVVLSPRPASRHARSATRLAAQVGTPFDLGQGGPGGWIILHEPELHLGPDPDVLVPDLAGWRREHMPELPDTPAFTLAPDWVCEVVSPSTAAMDRADKMPIYAREDVGHLWLVDPAVQTLEVFRLVAGSWQLGRVFKGDALVRAEPFEAVELQLGRLWER